MWYQCHTNTHDLLILIKLKNITFSEISIKVQKDLVSTNFYFYANTFKIGIRMMLKLAILTSLLLAKTNHILFMQILSSF